MSQDIYYGPDSGPGPRPANRDQAKADEFAAYVTRPHPDRAQAYCEQARNHQARIVASMMVPGSTLATAGPGSVVTRVAKVPGSGLVTTVQYRGQSHYGSPESCQKWLYGQARAAYEGGDDTALAEMEDAVTPSVAAMLGKAEPDPGESREAEQAQLRLARREDPVAALWVGAVRLTVPVLAGVLVVLLALGLASLAVLVTR